MALRDAIGWRFLNRRHRALLSTHAAAAEPLFEEFESEDPTGLTIISTPLDDMVAGRTLKVLTPDQLTSTVVTSLSVLRKIPIDDQRRTVSLLPPTTYRRHFAAQRILQYAGPLGLVYTSADVSLMLELALTSGNLDTSLRKIDIKIPPAWPPYEAATFIDQVLSEVRLPLYDVAIGAAESLLSGEFTGDVAEQLRRSFHRLDRVSPSTFEIQDLLDRIEAIQNRPIGYDDSMD